MAERSFKEEVGKLRLGAGEEFRGEGILAITKALLESGVSYVAGYQGAPISHLMDVLADANDILEELGVHFENSASEVFLTVPRLVAMNTNLPSSNSLIDSMALMRSPSCRGRRFTMGLPRDPRLACGS